MRFHIGFSKRIGRSTLLKIFGFLFVGALAFLGFIQQGYAWDGVDIYSTCYTNQTCQYNKYSYDADEGEDTLLEISVNEDTSSTNGTSKIFIEQDYRWQSAIRILDNNYFAMSSSYSTNNNITELDEFSTFLFQQDSSYCSNVSGTKSIDFQFGFLGNYIINNNYAFFTSVNNVGDTFAFYMDSIDSTNNKVYSSECSATMGGTTGEYLISCPSLYWDSNIDYYKIIMKNKIPFLNRFVTSSDSRVIRYPLYISRTSSLVSSFSSLTSPLMYECSSDEPVYSTTDETYTTNDMFAWITDGYSTSLPGIDTSLIIDYPSNIQELISLPIYILQNINDRSNTCTPYELDLTGLAKIGNPSTSDIKITLPCMREKLNTLLSVGNFSLYGLIDMLLSAIVFYNVAMSIIRFLEHLTDGDNLLLYFFGSDAYRSRHRF